MATRKALGRGLQSLIPKRTKTNILPPGWDNDDSSATAKESIFNVEVNKIRPNPYQPRKEMSRESLNELAASIREHGVLQPLIVTKIEKTTEHGQDVEYELIAGERRLRASKIAGLPHVPVIIRGISPEKKLAVALVENVQREDLNAIEAALAYRQLKDRFGFSQAEIAKKVGKDRVVITNTLRLLALPEEVQNAVKANKITEGHGRAILMAKPDQRLNLLGSIMKNGWNVRRAEEQARVMVETAGYKLKTSGPKSHYFKMLENDLVKILGHRVSISLRKGSGHLRIDFPDKPALDKIVGHLMKFK